MEENERPVRDDVAAAVKLLRLKLSKEGLVLACPECGKEELGVWESHRDGVYRTNFKCCDCWFEASAQRV